MLRPSFRTALLASYLAIVGILAAVAASGWLSLEQFARNSREGGAAAVALSSAVQQLGERTVDMERSARQFLVLEDTILRERFAAAHAKAVGALAQLETALPDARPIAHEWRTLAERTRNALASVAMDGQVRAESAGMMPTGSRRPVGADAPDATRGVTAPLARLVELNDAFALRVRERIDAYNLDMLEALDRKREALAGQIVAAIVLALALAALTGWWLLRPLRRFERAIAELGDNRFDAPIAVGGPSDLRQLGHRMDWLRLRLAELEANRNRVLRHVSHELKTPLSSLREGVALLADGVLGRLSPEQREVTGILDHNARALQERIEQLLDYNAIQFDARRLELRPTALSALAHQVAAELQLQAQARKVRVTVSGDAPPVAADAGKLRIALSNLLANAINFSPEGEEVRMQISAQGGGARIDCCDGGPGVAPAEEKRIFEPFFQGSRRAQRPGKGNGLGLAIVREFVTAHGGSVEVVRATTGAHFRIELPNGA